MEFHIEALLGKIPSSYIECGDTIQLQHLLAAIVVRYCSLLPRQERHDNLLILQPTVVGAWVFRRRPPQTRRLPLRRHRVASRFRDPRPPAKHVGVAVTSSHR